MRMLAVLYFLVVNLVAFISFGLDKQRAKRKMWRIPESTLLLFSIVGGSVGAGLGMAVFHHKTKHWKFKVGIPLIFVLQVLLLLYVVTKLFK